MSEDAFIRVVKRAQADLLARLRGDGPKRRWWLSFAAAEFLGACSVEAPTFLAAVKVAHALGINPGGECLGIEVPAGLEGPARFHDRLLTKAEADEFGSETGISGGLVVHHGSLSAHLSDLGVLGIWTLLGIVLAVRGFSWEAHRD